jgi:hypothetical protein
MRSIDANTDLQPSAPWASIDIAELGDEHVASPAPDARILVIEISQNGSDRYQQRAVGAL